MYRLTLILSLSTAVQLTTASQNVTINSTASEVSFSCEMSDYILPDRDLQWSRNHGIVLENSKKYTITYENGRPSASQNGGNIRVPSRISTLTIHSPTTDDTGEFTCALNGAQYIAIDLKVEAMPIKPRTVPSDISKLESEQWNSAIQSYRWYLGLYA